MKLALNFFSERIEFPAAAEPAWGSQVQRWYQLDPAAFAIVEFYSRLESKLARPACIFLASSDGSTETDWQFAHTGANGPNKFVHTLPSIRLSPLLEKTRWRLPTLCLQAGDQTWVSALEECLDGTLPFPAWVLGLEKLSGEVAKGVPSALPSNSAKDEKAAYQATLTPASQGGISALDRDLHNYFSQTQNRAFRLSSRWVLEKP